MCGFVLSITTSTASLSQPTPVAVVVIFVVAPQGSEAAEADGVGEEDLSPGVHPHLRREWKQDIQSRKYLYNGQKNNKSNPKHSPKIVHLSIQFVFGPRPANP